MKCLYISTLALFYVLCVSSSDYSRLKVCQFNQEYFIRASTAESNPEPRALIKQTENLLAKHVCDNAYTVSEKQFKRNYELLLYKLNVDQLHEIAAVCNAWCKAVCIVGELEEHFGDDERDVGKFLFAMQSDVWSMMDEDDHDEYLCNLKSYIKGHKTDYCEQHGAPLKANAAKQRAFVLLELSLQKPEFWEYVEYVQDLTQRMSFTEVQQYIPRESARLRAIISMIQRAAMFRQRYRLGSETVEEPYVWKRVPRTITTEDED